MHLAQPLKGAELPLHFSQRTVWCQNVSISCCDMGISSIYEKLRDDCTHIAKALHLTARCEETRPTSVCTCPACLQSNILKTKSYDFDLLDKLKFNNSQK